MTDRPPYDDHSAKDQSEVPNSPRGAAGRPPEVPAEGMTSAAAPAPARAPADAGESLARRASSGGMLMGLQTGVSQVINLAGFVILGYLLTESDQGLFAQTVTIAALATLLQQIGIRSTLISRASGYAALGGAAAILMLAGGVVVALAIAAGAPLIARLYDSPDLVPLIHIIALSFPFNAAAIVAESKLQIDLRFGSMVRIQFFRLLGEMLSIIALALFGFGPYALVIPRTVFTISASIDYWWLARPRLGLGRERRVARFFRNLRRLLRDARHLAPANVANYFGGQGDRIILSIFASDAIVGLYAFALSLVSRPALVLDRSMSSVLTPVLGRLRDEPERQARGYVRAARLAAAASVPLCLMIAVGAEPIMHTIMHPRWIPSIPMVQWLSLASMFAIIVRTHAPLLDMQRRFRARMILNLIHAAVLVGLVLVAAKWGDPVNVAQAVAGVQFVVGAIKLRVAVGGGGLGWADVGSIVIGPFAAGAVASIVAFGARELLPDEGLGWWAQLPVVPLTFTAAYAVGLRVLAPNAFRELRDQASPILRRVPGLKRFVAA